MYPSTFGGNSAPVVALEENSESHFLGPRGLKFNKREAEAEEDEVMSRSRRGLNDELGVLSGYQVISEVDLAFKPSFEDGVGVTVFQVGLTQSLCYQVLLMSAGPHHARGDRVRRLPPRHRLLRPLRAARPSHRHQRPRLR